MCSARDNTALPVLGFPIRASAGHWPFSASPGLIAAVHALHRLLVPRHPPCALTILTVIAVICGCKLPSEKSKIFPRQFARRIALIPVSLATVQFSRSGKRCDSRAEARDQVRERRRRAGLSKLNSTRAIGWRRLHWEKSARNASVSPPEMCRFLPSVIAARRLRQVRSTLLELIA